jgi:DNA-binding transcriptional ArsR family regulator
VAQPLPSPDRLFEALGDGTRRQIFERVARRPSSVAEVAEGLPVSRPAVSQHLKKLTEAGLVVSEAKGTKRIYKLHARSLETMRRWLDVIWDDALQAFAEEVEKGNDDGSSSEQR